MKYLILLFFLYGVIEAKQMPKNIKACSRKDPNLNECFKKNGNLAMEYIAKGDPKYDINTLLPLKWEDYIHIETPTIPSFKLSLVNITVYGLQNCKIVKPNINLEEKMIQFTLINPSIIWKQHYNASIEIDNFIHEIDGKGQIEFVDGEFLMTYNYDYYLDNGARHAKIVHGTSDFINYKLNFNLENLDQNKFIKKYWKKAQKYLVNDQVLDRAGAAVGRYIDTIFKHVPFDLVFTA